MPDINLSPYAPETAAIQRRLQMAQLLSQQAMQPMEVPQQAGVRASNYGGLAKILQGYMAGQEEKGALQEYKNLAEKYQGQNQADLQSFLGAIQGTPERELAGPAPQGAPTGVSSEGEMGGYIQPEQKADRNRAMALALGSQNPTLQGAGGAMLSQMFAQDKIKDFKVELVDGKTHRIGLTETGKRIDLGPVAESVSVDTAARLEQEAKLQGDRLKQERELSDRAFNGLSANQKATLANEGARLGISGAELYFNTGMKVGGVPNVGAPAAPNVSVAPNVSAAPVASNPVTPTAQTGYTPLSGLSPKAQQEVAKAVALEQIVPKPLTESQGNATAYGMRMAEANKLLTDLEKKGVTNTGIVRSAIGGTVGLTPFIGDKLQDATNALINPLPTFLGGPSSEQQQVDQARRNFITAVLRKESGAAIGASEFANEEKKYFPQVGDTDQVIKQKQDARELAIKAMGIQAGPGAKSIPNVTVSGW
jgi:hypothetical protein